MLPAWRENPYQELLAEHLRALGVEVASAGARRARRPRRVLRDGVDVLHVHGAARLYRADGTLEAWRRAALVLASLVWLRLRGVRLVWTAHDLQDHDGAQPRLDWLFTWALAHLAHRIIVHGERAGALLRARYRLGAGRRLAAIPHGPFEHYARALPSRADARAALGLPPDAPVLLFLGAIRPYKGVDALLAAFAAVAARHPEARLVVRGRARDSEHARALEARARQSAAVDLRLEYVAEADVPRYAAACDAFVLPYRDVLTSGSVALAQACGRACVAPDLEGLRDALDERCALLYDPRDRRGLERALERAVADRDALAALGECGRQRARRTPWREVAERTRVLYAA